MTKQAVPIRGYVIAFMSTALWSASAVFISYLTTRFGMPPMPLAFWRDLLATCILGAVLAIFARPLLRLDRRHVRFFLLYGLVLAFMNILWTISISLNGAALATLLLYLSPALTAVMGWRFFDEPLTAPTIVAIALSLIGCVFASGAYNASVWQVNPMGIISGLGTGLVFSVYSLLGKASSRKGVNPWTATLYTFAIGSGLLLLLQRPARHRPGPADGLFENERG